MKKIRTRFAPSPTGYMHLGNVWIAFWNWVWTRQNKGEVLLRIEDIDTQRCKPEYVASLQEDLEWLGLDWDEGPGHTHFYGSLEQSKRGPIYEKIIKEWEIRKRLYPCYCARGRLSGIASAPHEGERKAFYDGHCRFLTERERSAYEKIPSWRLKTEKSNISFEDLILGKQETELSPGKDDCIVKRADGIFAYQLAVSIDDASMGITHVFRGRDLLESTFYQIYMLQLLGKKIPVYGHLPLLVDEDDVRISKRQKGLTLQELRREGMTPEMVFGYILKWAGILAFPEPMHLEYIIRNISFSDVTNLSCRHIYAEL